MKTNSSAIIVPDPASNASTNDIRGIKAPVEISNPWIWLWWLLGALIVAALAAWLWRKFQRKRSSAAPVVIVPAHERALEKLQEALALLGQPRPFCIAVSDATRVYLEERFDFRAPERTTEEFLDELQSSALLSFDQKQTLGEFLMRCDLVKFARYEPVEQELRQLYDAAVRLIEETQPPPPLAETDSKTGVGATTPTT